MNMRKGSIKLGQIGTSNDYYFTVDNNGNMTATKGIIGNPKADKSRYWTIGGDTNHAYIYSNNKSTLSNTNAGTYIGTDGIEIRGKSGNRKRSQLSEGAG